MLNDKDVKCYKDCKIKLDKQLLSTNYLPVNIYYREKLKGDDGFSDVLDTKDRR